MKGRRRCRCPFFVRPLLCQRGTVNRLPLCSAGDSPQLGKLLIDLKGRPCVSTTASRRCSKRRSPIPATARSVGANWSTCCRGSALIDLYRLARLNGALAGEDDYARFADVTLNNGFPGEAKALLEQGFASNAIDRNSATIKSLYATATAKTAGDRAALDAQAAKAQSSGTAKALLTLSEAFYGYGDYAKSAAMARAALGKPGVDTQLANLRLGIALAASGDKAGAKTALDLVNGDQKEVAGYWLTYLASRP